MAGDWNHNLILEFLCVYKEEPVLWDPMHAWHKDKDKINEAWFRLSEILQRSVRELKKKKDSLMATFRGHLRRKKASIRSGAGDIYKTSWFAFELMESFLGPIYECSTVMDTQDATEFITVDDEDEENEIVIKDIVPTLPAASSVIPYTTTRRESPCELQETRNHTRETANGQNNVSNNRASKEEDECDLFAKILIKKLRKLSEHERLVFMYEIDGMFLNRICENNSSAVPTISYAPSMHHMNRSFFNCSQPQTP